MAIYSGFQYRGQRDETTISTNTSISVIGDGIITKNGTTNSSGSQRRAASAAEGLPR
jgi:hypothetical protein